MSVFLAVVDAPCLIKEEMEYVSSCILCFVKYPNFWYETQPHKIFICELDWS